MAAHGESSPVTYRGRNVSRPGADSIPPDAMRSTFASQRIPKAPDAHAPLPTPPNFPESGSRGAHLPVRREPALAARAFPLAAPIIRLTIDGSYCGANVARHLRSLDKPE